MAMNDALLQYGHYSASSAGEGSLKEG